MIPFAHYFTIITEGGNVFKNNPTVRINLENIMPTVSFLSGILGIDLSKNLLGSTGKRPSSGDLDIGIPETKMSKDEVYRKLANWCEERNLNPKDYIAKSGISVHFRTPIIGRDGEFAQTDFMLVRDLKFAKFALANNESEPFKGVHRNIVISNISKNLNLKFGGMNGLSRRDTGELIENSSPDRIAQILLGDQRAKERDLASIPDIINFLLKKYKDKNVVLGMLSDARETILKDGHDINSLIGGQPLNESTDSKGNRSGVQHLYSDYKSDEYSMDYENFKSFIEALEKNRGVIEPGVSSVSEKADGMAVRFGIDTAGKYFLQSSYSGPVTDGNFDGKVKYEPVKVAFEREFLIIKKAVFNILKKHIKESDLDGIRVQAEWLYSPLALKREDNPNVVYFVATNYDLDKLGKWSTFPIIDITDGNGNPIEEAVKYSITSDLVSASSENIKFLPLDIEVFTPIDLSGDMRAAKQEIATFEVQNPNWESVLYNISRKKPDTDAKKEMRAHIVRILNPYQKSMHEKILNNMHKFAGKLGEYEGLVIKLKNRDGSSFTFKVISPSFHKNKGRI